MKNHYRSGMIRSILLLCFLAVLGITEAAFAGRVTDPMAAAVGKTLGFVMSGQNEDAETITNVEIHDVRARLREAITEEGFFLSGVIIKRFDASEDGGTIEGITIHQDKFSRTIYTRFRADYRGGRKVRVKNVRSVPVTNSYPRTAFFIVPSDQISVSGLEQTSFAEALQMVMAAARKVEGRHRADGTPRAYLGIFFFMEKRSSQEMVKVFLSGTPGGMSGTQNGNIYKRNGWVMGVVPARFAYDSGAELFFNVLIVEEGDDPRVVGVFSTHSLIRRLQRALKKRGYDPGLVDGRMGGQTRQALQAFQKDQGLYVDGKPSPALLSLLSTPDLPRAVKVVQQALSRIGYDVGSIDGLPGPKTRQAVKAFQEDRLLNPDGTITAEIVSMLTDAAVIAPPAAGRTVSPAAPRSGPGEVNRYEERMWPNRTQR